MDGVAPAEGLCGISLILFDGHAKLFVGPFFLAADRRGFDTDVPGITIHPFEFHFIPSKINQTFHRCAGGFELVTQLSCVHVAFCGRQKAAD